MARAKRRTRPRAKRPAVPAGDRRARLLSARRRRRVCRRPVCMVPGQFVAEPALDLAGTEAQLSTLHSQDAALAQEQKNLSDAGEIGRIAREQYQLVGPGQQGYEVLPPPGSSAGGSPYAGDPGTGGPVTPSAASELPPGGTTTTTVPATSHAGGAPSAGQGATVPRATKRPAEGPAWCRGGARPRILALTRVRWRRGARRARRADLTAMVEDDGKKPATGRRATATKSR